MDPATVAKALGKEPTGPDEVTDTTPPAPTEVKEPEPAAPVADPAPAPAPAPEAPKPEVAAPVMVEEKPIGEVMGDTPPPADPAPTTDTVPLAVFLEEKGKRKDLEKAVADLKEKFESGATRVEITEDVKALGEKYEIDPTFLAELTGAITSKVKGETAAEREAQEAPRRAEEAKERFEAAFKEHFGKALEAMPEFKDIVNPEVIKTLSLDPKNAKKTFSQLIEETYGNAVPGKRTLDAAQPGGGNEPESIDYSRAAKDNAYLSTILANPALKKEYNANLHKRLGL